MANCFLDLSLVVWSMDAEQMLTYHRQIWEMMDHTKALDNTDFRVPTEGAMWGGMWTDADRTVGFREEVSHLPERRSGSLSLQSLWSFVSVARKTLGLRLPVPGFHGHRAYTCRCLQRINLGGGHRDQRCPGPLRAMRGGVSKEWSLGWSFFWGVDMISYLYS